LRGAYDNGEGGDFGGDWAKDMAGWGSRYEPGRKFTATRRRKTGYVGGSTPGRGGRTTTFPVGLGKKKGPRKGGASGKKGVTKRARGFERRKRRGGVSTENGSA